MKYLKIIILIILIMYSLFASFYIFSNKKTIRTQNENIIYYRTQNDSLLFLVKKLSEIPAINVEATAKIELTNKAVFGKITANNNEIQAIIKDCTVMIKDSILNHKNGRK